MKVDAGFFLTKTLGVGVQDEGARLSRDAEVRQKQTSRTSLGAALLRRGLEDVE